MLFSRVAQGEDDRRCAAGAIAADQRDPLTGFERAVDAIEQGPVAVGLIAPSAWLQAPPPKLPDMRAKDHAAARAHRRRWRRVAKLGEHCGLPGVCPSCSI